MTSFVKSKTFDPRYAIELISIAEADLAAAYDLWHAKTNRKENIFLMAQQGLEKALKAVLCAASRPVPFVHDIAAFVTLVSQVAEPPFGHDLNELTEFATVRRCYEGWEPFSDEEISAVLETTKAAIRWCASQVRVS